MVLDIKFLHGCSEPTIALIHEDTKVNILTFAFSFFFLLYLQGTPSPQNFHSVTERQRIIRR